MTFILNLLHKDFSLIAGDQMGQATGPVTVSLGGLTVKIQNAGNENTTITGLQKIKLSNNRLIALGVAGTLSDHDGYSSRLQEISDPSEAMKSIHRHMTDFFDFDGRDTLLEGKTQELNQSLLTFFDKDKEAFFTCYHQFSKLTFGSALYARRMNAAPTLVHAGSGSSKFEEAMGLDEINAFLDRVKAGISLEETLAWFVKAFLNVSKCATGCGADFTAYISTRENPEFLKVHDGNPEGTMSFNKRTN